MEWQEEEGGGRQEWDGKAFSPPQQTRRPSRRSYVCGAAVARLPLLSNPLPLLSRTFPPPHPRHTHPNMSLASPLHNKSPLPVPLQWPLLVLPPSATSSFLPCSHPLPLSTPFPALSPYPPFLLCVLDSPPISLYSYRSPPTRFALPLSVLVVKDARGSTLGT